MIATIDKQSLSEYGQWPWPRSLTARLLDAIEAQSPIAVGLDILMPEPDRISPPELLKHPPEQPLPKAGVSVVASERRSLSTQFAAGSVPVVAGNGGPSQSHFGWSDSGCANAVAHRTRRVCGVGPMCSPARAVLIVVALADALMAASSVALVRASVLIDAGPPVLYVAAAAISLGILQWVASERSRKTLGLALATQRLQRAPRWRARRRTKHPARDSSRRKPF